MEQKSLLKCGRPGWMGLHTLEKDQKVPNSCGYRLMTQVRFSNLKLKTTRKKKIKR